MNAIALARIPIARASCPPYVRGSLLASAVLAGLLLPAGVVLAAQPACLMWDATTQTWIPDPGKATNANDGVQEGTDNTACQTTASSLGLENMVNGIQSAVAGNQNKVWGNQSSAFGVLNEVRGNAGHAVGFLNRVVAGANAFGNSNRVTGSGGNAIGNNNAVSGEGGSAAGNQNTASGSWSSAFGYGGAATGQGSVVLSGWFDRNGNDARDAGETASANGQSAVAAGAGATAYDHSSVAIGVGSVAGNGDASLTTGRNSVAVGTWFDFDGDGVLEAADGDRVNSASGMYGSAFGVGNTASGNYSSAFGYHNDAGKLYSSAFGYRNTASGIYGSAFGYYNSASGSWSSAFGVGNTASGFASSAFGYYNAAIGTSSSAFGYGSRAAANNSTALGYQATANEAGVVSFGHAVGDQTGWGSTYSDELNARLIHVAAGVANTDAVNVGQLNDALDAVGGAHYVSIHSADTATGSNYANDGAVGNDATAIGVGAHAWDDSSLAIGIGSVAGNSDASLTTGRNSVAVGTWYDADGDGVFEASFDRVNSASGVKSSAFGVGNTASGNASSAVGHYNTASGDYSSAIGQDNSASGSESSAVGRYNKANGGSSSALGRYNVADGFDSSAIGSTNRATGVGSSALGRYNVADGIASSAFGYYNTVSGKESSAFGTYSQAAANYSTALGYQAVSNEEGVVSFGHSATDLSVFGGAYGSDWNARLIHVAAGIADTDAVNVGQLSAAILGSAVDLSPFAAAFGGGAAWAGGVFTPPGYTIQGVAYGNVGAALSAIDSWMTGNASGVQYDDPGHATVTLDGASGTQVKNLADGTDAADAVNKGQMDAGDAATLAQSKAYSDTRETAVRSDMAAGDAATLASANSHAEAGDAVTLASANAHADAGDTTTLAGANAYTAARFAAWNETFDQYRQEVDLRFAATDARIDRMGAMGGALSAAAMNTAGLPGQNRVGVGVSAQNGRAAMAVGYQRLVAPNASISLGGAFSGGESNVSVGAGFSW